MDILTNTTIYMKKLFTLICAVAITSGTFAQNRYDVTKKAEFTDALTQIAALPAGSAAYVYISGYVDVGTLKSGDGNIMANTLRNIHFIGINDEEGNRATLSMEMQLPADNTEADGFSLHYENLKLRQTQGVWGNSKHLMNFKDAKKHYVDTLEFINCELTELCRSLYRGEVNGAGEDYTGAGTLKVFRMENCVVHNGFRQSSAMPAIYMAQPINEMTFRNNTFYDLTYLNGLVSFGNVSENAGRQAVKVIFENNTVCAWSKSSLLGFTGGVSTESEFHIKNNIILQPTWADEMNGRFGDTKDAYGDMQTIEENPEAVNGLLTADEIQARIDKGVVLTNLEGGLVQQENNLLFGYKYQNLAEAIEAGDIIPIGDTEDESFDEFAPALTMEDVPFAWTDFTDAQNDMFQINFSAPAYTAGKNGAPLGDTNNYTTEVIKEVTVSVKVQGSETVSFTIDPIQEKYFTGNKITITLNDHNNALRTLNTFKGWSDGSMETTRVIELEGDIDLTATYETAINNVVSWFDFGITPTQGQNKLPDYKADVFAEGNQAVATLFYVPSIVDGEGTAIGLEEGYKEADGTENRFNWRSGKFGEDDANQQICVISRKTSPLAHTAGTPDFFAFTFSTKDLKGIEFSAFCGTDNFGYKTQLADYSLDGGQTWTNFAKVDLESRDAEYSIGAGKLWGWTELKGILPAAAENQEKVMVRVIGDATGEKIDNVVSEIDQENANMFEYTGAVLIRHSVEGAPAKKGDVNGDGEVDVADISSIITVMAAGSDDAAADVNEDGKVDVADISSVITIMASSN